MSRAVSTMLLYNALETWLRDAISAAWTAKSTFGLSTVPITTLPRAAVRVFDPDGGGVSGKGTAHDEEWEWQFEIYGTFSLADVAGDVLPEQMSRLEEIIQELTPYTLDGTVPASSCPVSQVSIYYVSEFGPLDPDQADGFYQVMLVLNVTTHITV
jgi:hypothetical protein